MKIKISCFIHCNTIKVLFAACSSVFITSISNLYVYFYVYLCFKCIFIYFVLCLLHYASTGRYLNDWMPLQQTLANWFNFFISICLYKKINLKKLLLKFYCISFEIVFRSHHCFAKSFLSVLHSHKVLMQ